MNNYPAGAQHDPRAPYNQQPDPIDQQMVDMATQDLETVLERVKDSNGNFPDKFHRLMEELLMIKFEK
jgi:CBS-domain-containing membrane protein